MADIVFECPYCSKENTVSEFVDQTALSCQHCEKKVSFDDPDYSEEEFNPESIQKELQQELDKTKKVLAPPKKTNLLGHFMLQRKRKKTVRLDLMHHLICWGIFILLGAIMFFLRYRGGVSPSQVNVFKQIAPLVIMGLHLFCTYLGFTCALFQGILCLFIPGYSFFYFFYFEGNYYARAILGGLLIGLGVDGIMYWKKILFVIFGSIYGCITRGVY